ALENGETKYKQFLFPQALQTPGCVIHLEEINRPEHPKALNMLFSLLSDDRQVWMDELGLLNVADGVVFNSELAIDISTRTTLMIGEMVAAQATLREAISTSLQTNKEVLESILISLHLEKGYLEKGESEYMLFTKNVALNNK
ncbi:MAG: CbbQ/NirQ/NorQ/GpvN family protein, partial [Desulfobacteraceae bacterium 4572_187]